MPEGITDWLPYINLIIPYLLWRDKVYRDESKERDKKINNMSESLAVNTANDLAKDSQINQSIESFESRLDSFEQSVDKRLDQILNWMITGKITK